MDPVSILNWIALGNAVLPRVASALTHYQELGASGKLDETDKERMKENLEGLKLPGWDSI